MQTAKRSALSSLLVIALLAAGGYCKTDETIEPSPVQVRNEACMEACREDKCPEHEQCYTDCAATNMQAAIAACEHRCDIRFRYCEDACGAECDARYPDGERQ